jgi:hypothetical protein
MSLPGQRTNVKYLVNNSHRQICVKMFHYQYYFGSKVNSYTGVSRLEDITEGGDFLGLCDKKSSYKHVSDFGRLRSYGHSLIPVHVLV